jgi:hypothetical protein
MFDRIAMGVKRILQLDHPARFLEVFPDDIFILSYPKSGNTWTRFLIANLVYPEKKPDFANINLVIPDPEALSRRTLAKLPRPRILKSHEYFHPRYPRVIYIVRDPRDVAVSQYHFHIKRRLITEGYPIEKFVRRFVAGDTSIYGSWGENVAGWLATRSGSPNFLLLKYEDMLADTRGELVKMAAFLKMPVTRDLIENAVERSSAKRMREMEQTQSLAWTSTKNTRQDIPFVRTAKSGNWRSELPEEAVAHMERAWAQTMRACGYELNTPVEDKREFDLVLHGIRT